MATTGRRRTGRYCWIRYAPLPRDERFTDALANPYIGYAIGRNIGSAVVRNRIRRRLRAILATDSDLVPGLYLVGVKHARAATMDFDDLRRDVNDVVAQVVESMTQEATSS